MILTDLVLRRRVVGVNHRRSHLPLGFIGWFVDLFHVLSKREHIHFDVVLKVIILVQLELNVSRGNSEVREGKEGA